MSQIAIVVTHLLGTGHLARALTLARAFRDCGHETCVLTGGMPVAHFDTTGLGVVQLPPLRSDGVNFTRLLTADGSQADDAYLRARTKFLIDAVAEFAPDALITELFPFGRRVLKAEFTELLQASQRMTPKPRICCSIRDILAPPSKQAKADATHDLIAQYYDAVLVHSDQTITPLDASWPVTDAFKAKLRYTGFVATPAATDHPQALGTGEVLVSAGGGNVGTALFKSALGAAALDSARTWRLLVGGADAAHRCEHLRLDAPPNTLVEPARPEFRQMLRHAAASVSMCGYNTALDLLQAATPSVLVPFDDGFEVEQSLRARALSQLDGFEMISSAEATPDTLKRAVDRVITAPRRGTTKLQMNGAEKTVQIVMSLLKERTP